jgi:hypothetical protein
MPPRIGRSTHFVNHKPQIKPELKASGERKTTMKKIRKLRAGDLVEIRSKQEILQTLDKNGRLEGLPFMPQMFKHCGQRFKVFKRAHKTCDTVNVTGGRKVPNAVHLDLRCDGEAYGGCQAACLIFWKEAWLKPVDERNQPPETWLRVKKPWVTEVDVLNATRTEGQGDGETRYFCQATELPYFTSNLFWRNISQYMEDYTSGNVTLHQMFSGFVYAWYNHFSQPGSKFGAPLRWLYDQFQNLWGGVPYPRKPGLIPEGQLTPTCTLNLQPGELVRVKPYEEILKTVDANRMNRGLSFDAEAAPYCGGVFRVRARVDKFIDETTGRLKTLKTPAVMLDGVWCQSRYSDTRMLCPRRIYIWWREIWLERTESPTKDAETAS